MLAMTYKQSGIRVVSAFQTNRAGHEFASEHHYYKISSLAELNEAERSADVIITLFLGEDDELRSSNQIRMQWLKNRDGELNTTTWMAYFAGANRFIGNLVDEHTNFDSLLSLDV